jgi:integrase
VQFRKAWAKACRLAGIQGRLFHDFRRPGVRNLIRAGVPRSIAMRISGHATERIFERYNIDTDKELEDALEAVSDYVRRLPSEPQVRPLRRAVASVSE